MKLAHISFYQPDRDETRYTSESSSRGLKVDRCVSSYGKKHCSRRTPHDYKRHPEIAVTSATGTIFSRKKRNSLSARKHACGQCRRGGPGRANCSILCILSTLLGPLAPFRLARKMSHLIPIYDTSKTNTSKMTQRRTHIATTVCVRT